MQNLNGRAADGSPSRCSRLSATPGNVAELIQHESAMVERFALPAAAPLSDADLTLITEFSTWCNQRRVRALPSRPEVVGTFIQEIAHRGPEYVLSMVEAIGRNAYETSVTL